MFLNLDMMIYIVVNKRPAHFALVPRQSFWAKILKSYYTFQPLQLMIDIKFFFPCVLDAKDSGTGTGTGACTACIS